MQTSKTIGKPFLAVAQSQLQNRFTAGGQQFIPE
jgi:hypothetical protein